MVKRAMRSKEQMIVLGLDLSELTLHDQETPGKSVELFFMCK